MIAKEFSLITVLYLITPPTPSNKGRHGAYKSAIIGGGLLIWCFRRTFPRTRTRGEEGRKAVTRLQYVKIRNPNLNEVGKDLTDRLFVWRIIKSQKKESRPRISKEKRPTEKGSQSQNPNQLRDFENPKVRIRHLVP